MCRHAGRWVQRLIPQYPVPNDVGRADACGAINIGRRGSWESRQAGECTV